MKAGKRQKAGTERRAGRRWPTALVLVLVLWAGGLAVAEVDWTPATVTLGDGTVLRGKVHLPQNRFYLLNEAQQRRYSVDVAELKTFESVIERQGLEDKWIFRESGRDDKVYTGERFPVRYYQTRVTFGDGRQLTGHMIAKTLYVDVDGEKQRYILRRKDEGKVGEQLTDLTYVRRIEFDAADGVRGTLEGTLKLPWGENLRTVVAVNRGRGFSIRASTDTMSGRFRVADCTEGAYDLVVVTDKAIYTCFSVERQPDGGRFDSEQVSELQGWVDKLRDFFHSQTVLYAAGTDRRACSLLLLERRGGTTLQGAELLHRYDVWTMHKPRDEWQIEKRMFVWRAVSRDLGLDALPVIVSSDLAGHAITADSPNLKIELDLASAEEENHVD